MSSDDILKYESDTKTNLVDDENNSNLLIDAKAKDLKSKIQQRPIISKYIFGLVIGQNLAVFSIWIIIIFQHKLEQYDLLLTSLLAATLGESYFLIKFIVGFTFSDFDGKIPNIGDFTKKL